MLHIIFLTFLPCIALPEEVGGNIISNSLGGCVWIILLSSLFIGLIVNGEDAEYTNI